MNTIPMYGHSHHLLINGVTLFHLVTIHSLDNCKALQHDLNWAKGAYVNQLESPKKNPLKYNCMN